jgi:thiamine-phosphate pyrophosphorylase
MVPDEAAWMEGNRLGGMSVDMSGDLRDRLRLYVITDSHLSRGRSTEDIVRAAIDGGATAIQLRAKDLDGLDMYRLAVSIRDITAAHRALFIVNDRLDVALAAGADGAHLGQGDLPLTAAIDLVRAATPERDFVLGVSARNLEQAVLAEKGGASYIGAGPVWFTPTKPDSAQPIGPAGLREICGGVGIPVVAIGGISIENARDVTVTGVAGLAVISAVVSAPDVREAARALAAITLRETAGTHRRPRPE